MQEAYNTYFLSVKVQFPHAPPWTEKHHKKFKLFIFLQNQVIHERCNV